MKKFLQVFWFSAVVVLTLFSAYILQGQRLSAEEAAATGGTIKVTVLAGEGVVATADKKLQTASDPFCAGKTVVDETVVLTADKKLQNVVAALDGVTGTFPAPTTPAVVDQNGCHYVPHVLTAQVGQKIQIKNSDTTLHNVHGYKGTATDFNRAMFQNMPPIEHSYAENGEVRKIKCDVHPWMTGFIYLTNHPFVGVTGADGTVTLSNVPAGTHNLKVWHEKLGEKTQVVTVTAGQTTEVSVSLAPPAPGA